MLLNDGLLSVLTGIHCRHFQENLRTAYVKSHIRLTELDQNLSAEATMSKRNTKFVRFKIFGFFKRSVQSYTHPV